MAALVDGGFMLGNPPDAEGGVDGPERVAADGELSFDADVFPPPGELRAGAGVVPTDERVEPASLLIHGQAVHAHAGDGDGADPGRVGQLGHGVAEGVGGAAPDLRGFPDGPVGVFRMGMGASGGSAGAGDLVSVEVVGHGFEARGAEVDTDEVVHGGVV
ncbi:MAG: hypothetical protein M5U12_35935 [Verrucomicrobia bacterium]|nr:hypothetical protein [Verrucomicrobiota bacterium]